MKCSTDSHGTYAVIADLYVNYIVVLSHEIGIFLIAKPIQFNTDNQMPFLCGINMQVFIHFKDAISLVLLHQLMLIGYSGD